MKQQPSEKKTGQLLTPTEREICKKIAENGDNLSNQRASILLLVDEGLTQAQVCEKSDMTIGQLRYALTLFRKSGMQMFSNETPAPQPQAKPVVPPAKEPVKLLVREVVEEVLIEKAKKKKKEEKEGKKKSKKNKKEEKPKKKKKKNREE